MIIIYCDECDEEVFDSRKNRANKEYKTRKWEEEVELDDGDKFTLKHSEEICLDCSKQRKEVV